MSSEYDHLSSLIDAQIDSQGIASLTVEDGTVLVMPVKALHAFIKIAADKRSDRVVIFLKTQKAN